MPGPSREPDGRRQSSRDLKPGGCAVAVAKTIPRQPREPLWEQATPHRGHLSEPAPESLYQEVVVQAFWESPGAVWTSCVLFPVNSQHVEFPHKDKGGWFGGVPWFLKESFVGVVVLAGWPRAASHNDTLSIGLSFNPYLRGFQVASPTAAPDIPAPPVHPKLTAVPCTLPRCNAASAVHNGALPVCTLTMVPCLHTPLVLTLPLCTLSLFARSHLCPAHTSHAPIPA